MFTIMKNLLSKKIEISFGKFCIITILTTLIVLMTIDLKNNITIPSILIILSKALGITLVLIQMQTVLEVAIKAFKDYYRDELFK